MSDDEIFRFIYTNFPNFKDYINANKNGSLVSLDENFDVTERASLILGERLETILSNENDPEMLKYQPYNGDAQKKALKPATKASDSFDKNLSYSKFPTHSQYMASDHMIDTLQSSDLSEPTDSTLPDIVSELKSRDIFVGPMRVTSEMDTEHRNATAINRLVGNLITDSLSESLEDDMRKMGLNWVTSMMKKTENATQLSTSSESNEQDVKIARACKRQRSSPSKLKSAITGDGRGNGHSNDKVINGVNDSNSFIDRNLVATLRPTESSRTTEQTEPDIHGKSMNLKDFLARELLKHSSSTSMSTDSSLGSIFLKSFLGRSFSVSDDQSGTPKNQRDKDKHRTSTPVQQISGVGRSSSTSNSRSETAVKCIKQNGGQVDAVENEHDLTPKFFSGDSHISSVGCTESALSSDDQRRKV